MKKRILFIMLICMISKVVMAQQNEKSEMQKMQDDFEKYKKEATDDFNSYRDKINKEFADYMKQEWEAFQTFKGIPVPKSPDPVTPPVKKDPQEKPEDHPVPQGKVIPLPEPQKQPQPIEPIPVAPQKEDLSVIDFNFFAVPCSVVWNDSLKFRLASLDGNTLAAAWNRLAGRSYNGFLADCISLRSKLELCDWGYVELVRQITGTIYGSPKTNEAVFLQMFVLSQTGYKVRIAQVENEQLVLLVNTDYEMYNKMFLQIGDAKFYLVDSSAKQLKVLNEGLPKEQPVSMRIENEQLANKTETTQKVFISKAYPVETVRTGVNKEQMDFYDTYPQCDWKVYANTPLSETVKNNLYPVLQFALKGKSEAEAANMLINFVQTAFEYKTDEEQFGYERPFFPDELFYYPYCDCEDRAVLYSTLVHDLLHLKVVLLHYPNHLATAVHFNEDVSGDYFMVNNLKYLVCDPTYIGAPIGDAMPQFKNVQAEVVIP
ncbi:hypothetical protein [uncultured Bacteroides sp.]|uniref:hypothetical protein n=1 Tax=uncultured Bacteroides sp. TaxID=162156 RepID=UPI002AABE600|nr:hypothetical protein [uncultured Bacteroides sp.]